MPKPERAWEVSPHHPFEKHEDNLWGVRAQLTAWAALPSLARIVPSHGELVTADAKGALQRIAATL